MIEIVSAFKINDKFFATEKEAKEYKHQCIDDVELGNTVVLKGHFDGITDIRGTVCYIEKDLIHFTVGDIPPKKYLMSGTIKHGWKNLEIEGKKYNFKICREFRKNLIRI